MTTSVLFHFHTCHSLSCSLCNLESIAAIYVSFMYRMHVHQACVVHVSISSRLCLCTLYSILYCNTGSDELPSQEYRRMEHWKHFVGLYWWSSEHAADVSDCLQHRYGGNTSVS